MPFLTTEPQKIAGTSLGFAVYPYHFSFNDHIENRGFNQKLVIVKLKGSPFIEVEKTLFEEKIVTENVYRNYIDDTLKKFVETHKEYIRDKDAVDKFFKRRIETEKVL